VIRKFMLTATVAPLVAGAGFGAAVSWCNDRSAVEGDTTATVLRTLSLVLGSGPVWAALAVAMGWWARAPLRAVVAGPVALLAATIAYYCTDSVLRDEPLRLYAAEMARWSVAGAILGFALGGVGAVARRRDLVGLAAGLALPVTVMLYITVRPPAAELPTSAPDDAARAILALLAVAAALAVTLRHVLGRQRR
jgi:hypothetical protein